MGESRMSETLHDHQRKKIFIILWTSPNFPSRESPPRRPVSPPGRLPGLRGLPGSGERAVVRRAGVDADIHPHHRPHGQVLFRSVNSGVLRAGVARDADARQGRLTNFQWPHGAGPHHMTSRHPGITGSAPAMGNWSFPWARGLGNTRYHEPSRPPDTRPPGRSAMTEIQRTAINTGGGRPGTERGEPRTPLCRSLAVAENAVCVRDRPAAIL